MSLFQSTLSVRRATLHYVLVGGTAMISIHALREESDRNRNLTIMRQHISIHALREESDQDSPSRTGHWTYFNPRSP